MGIFFPVRIAMVISVMCRPPQRAALYRADAQQREEKLSTARSLKGAMRKITMIKASNGEHANRVQRGSDCHCGPAPADPEYAKTSNMHEEQRQVSYRHEAMRLSLFDSSLCGPESLRGPYARP